MSLFENMDIVCASKGREIASLGTANLITNALAVLEEQGVYAFFLYLAAKGKNVLNSLYDFLKDPPGVSPLLSGEGKNIFDDLNKLGEDLDNLLFARDLLRQTMVYARYHAKAIDSEEE
jgi:hypothetical protein